MKADLDPVTIQCPDCGVDITLPVSMRQEGRLVNLYADHEPVYEHIKQAHTPGGDA